MYEIGVSGDKTHEYFMREEKEEAEIGLIDEDELDSARLVVGNPGRKKEFWKDTGCSDFVYSVLSKGYEPVFTSLPGKYKEKNNKSWKTHNEFGVELENGRIV